MKIGYFVTFILPILVKSQTLIPQKSCASPSSENSDARMDALRKVVLRQSEALRAYQKLEERVQLLETSSQQNENSTCKCFKESETVDVTTAPTNQPNLDSVMKRRLQTAGQFGKEFILAFPEVYTSVKGIQLLIASLADGRITILSDEPGVDRVVEISSEAGLSLTLPITLLKSGSFVGRKTVSLQSNTYIAVFVVVLGSSGTGDGYIAIPVNSLEKKYFFSMNQNALLSIVSFYDETVMSITSNAGTTIKLQSMGLSSNASITLQRGQVLQIRHTIAPGQYEVYHTNPVASLGVISYGFGKGINAAYGFPVCFKKF